MNALLNASIVLAAIVALGWTVLALRLVRYAFHPIFQFFEVLEKGTNPHPPTVHAIVPARNEAANVAETIASLRAQEYPHLTITVIDDQSTDRTAEILEKLSSEPSTGAPVRLIRGVERPEGWVGKTWAVHQGAIDATGDWLWFVDADMGLHPRALVSAVEAAEAAGADLISLLPGFRCETFWQGAIGAALVQVLGNLYPLDKVNDPARPEAIAAGGFILVRRDAYWRAGGHEAVRREIIEDIQLSKRIKATGGKLMIRLAPQVAWTHMYGKFSDIWRGLRKNAYAGMDYMLHKFIVGVIVALSMAWASWICLVAGLIQGSGLAIGIGVWGVTAQVLATAPTLLFLRLPFPFAFALPLGISAYLGIASSSVWHHHRGRILWKDRTIAASLMHPVASSRNPEEK